MYVMTYMYAFHLVHMYVYTLSLGYAQATRAAREIWYLDLVSPRRDAMMCISVSLGFIVTGLMVNLG